MVSGRCIEEWKIFRTKQHDIPKKALYRTLVDVVPEKCNVVPNSPKKTLSCYVVPISGLHSYVEPVRTDARHYEGLR